MSVFKRFQGKRIQEGDPNWDKGSWYVWRRVGKGNIIHRALKGVQSEAEALEIENKLLREVARRGDSTLAAQIAKQMNGRKAPKSQGYIYIIESGGHYKIGKTTNIVNRLSAITKTIIPFDTTLVCAMQVCNADEVEKLLHRQFAANRIKGEWFLFVPYELSDVLRRLHELRRVDVAAIAT